MYPREAPPLPRMGLLFCGASRDDYPEGSPLCIEYFRTLLQVDQMLALVL